MGKWYHKILPPGTWLYQKVWDFYFYQMKDVRGKLRERIQAANPLKIDLGAGYHTYEGWIAVDYPIFDISSPAHWEYYFGARQADHFLSEHVLEHLTYLQVETTVSQANKYLKKGGCFRIAVPDGFNPDKLYNDWNKPGVISDGHRTFWDHGSMTKILERSGYRVELIEYYTIDGQFISKDFNDDNGHIRRSKTKGYLYTGKHQGKEYTIPEFSSLIIDAYKI